MDSHPLNIVASSRPHQGEIENGDGWNVSRFSDLYRVSLIDGLGHGPIAANVTAVALRTLETLGPLHPSETIRRCSAALRGTRGAVMAVANIDLTKRRLTYAAVGNTEASLHSDQDDAITRLICDRGIVGMTLPTIHSTEIALPDFWRLLLYTDGIRDRFDLRAELKEAQTSSDWPEEFLERWGRAHDDATVVLVSPCTD